MDRLGMIVVAIAAVSTACGDDSSPPSADGSTSATTNSAASGTAEGSGASGAAEGSGASSSSAESGTSTSGDTPTTLPPPTTDDTSDDDSYCNGWDEEATEPFLELYSDTQMQQEMVSGGTWPITCGGQGSWMFALYPALGGFTAGTTVRLSVDVHVEGFTGPGGQFFLSPEYPYDVMCSSGGGTGIDGGFSHDCIAVLPPDKYYEDYSVLDGAVATIHVDLLDPDGAAVATVELEDIVLSAPEKRVSEDCFF